MQHRSAFIVAVFVLIAVPIAAQEPNNEIKVSIGIAEMPGFGDAGTFGVHYNRYWSDLLATNFGLTAFGADLDVGASTDEGELEMAAWSAALELHFLRGRRFSPYVGGGIAYVTSRLADTPAGDIDAEDEAAWLVSGGVDVRFSRRFALNVDGTYMPYDADFPPIASIDMDPFTVSVGAKFRW